MERKVRIFGRCYEKFLKKLEYYEVLKVENAIDILKAKQEFEFPRLVKQVVGIKGVYEFRTQFGNNELRIYYVYENNNLVVLFNGIKKKDQKILKKDLEKIKIIKKQYDKTVNKK